MTRVLVVDDSRFVRTVVGDALANAGYEVKSVADGESAVEAATSFEPDVVTMDVEMPGMSGIDAVERIMSTNPTAIVMLSAHTEAGAEATLDALGRGAMEFLQKPDGSREENLANLIDSVLETVDDLASADVSSLALARATAAAHRAGSARRRRAVAGGAATGPDERRRGSGDRSAGKSTTVTVDRETVDDPTVIVGASTGGPRILERLLATLPRALEAKIVIVQHMPAEFTRRFADRLDATSEYDVREAGEDDLVGGGEAVVAPGGSHLEIAENVDGEIRVELDDGERIHGVRPSIDVTMRTAAETVSDPLAGVVLTGMGRDGAAGIEAIAAAGGRTFAQDERSSPVFGIPQKAIETGAVDEIAPADDLPARLVDAFSVEGESHG
ncbi:chemotaxis-specific protein-glutamate methyltransferase CheB [Halovivax sp.]|uniref:chemotaxis-specific protein-glutamate methyltransferase CheB n=1 Tax=Halovivax sp. TaxID=1935978 RepID=UPI0025C5AEC0|nr:chemotaxis-specific protein-glutamate methyltransferase CheB [Halovivax sp.]